MDLKKMEDLNDEWLNFDSDEEDETPLNEEVENTELVVAPEPTDIYISTKTKLQHILNIENINLYEVFWKIKLINYNDQKEGIIKKQMKFISETQEQHDEIKEHLKKYENFYVEEYVISEMKADIGSKKFKDIRKISIGISKKDMITNRTKKKGHFTIVLRYNEMSGNGKFKRISYKNI